MNADDSDIENTTNGDERATEASQVDVTKSSDRPDETDGATTDEAVAGGSGVAAKAKARAQARADEQGSSRGKQFTVSARALSRVAAGVVILAILAVLGFCGWKWYDTEQELSAFDDSKAAASEYVTQYFGVLLNDGASADELKAKVGPLSTGKQKEQIDTSASETVKWRDTQKLENVTTKINTAMVESFSKDHAVTVVSFEFTGTSATAPGGGRAVTLIQLTLDKVDGDWLVSNVQAVPGMAGGSTEGQNPQTGPVPAMPTQPAG